MRHPIQPIERDEKGVLRFKENAIVTHLLNWATSRGCSINNLACLDFTDEDRQQFAQLIGYSLSGYSELSYVSYEAYEIASSTAEGKVSEDRARVEYLEGKLERLKAAFRVPVSRLYDIHPDDLNP